MEITEENALCKIAAYCSSAERCKADVQERLQRWGLPYDGVRRILDYLVKERFLDDERYCRAFVNDKFRFSKWGKQKIAQGLYMKKIPSEMAWRHLSALDESDYLEVLRSLITSKRKSISAKDDYDLNQKLIRFALSRGFEFKDIKRCLDVEVDYDEENL